MARQLFCQKCREWFGVPSEWTKTQARREHNDMHRRQDEIFHSDELAELDLLLESMYDLPDS